MDDTKANVSALLSAGLAVGILAAAAFCPVTHGQERGRKYKAPPPVSRIDVIVTRASNDKPVENASVIFHTFHNGKDQGNMEVKTNEDGKAELELIPLGDQVQLQVFKSGFQTYGESFTNDEATRELAIKVKPPTGQYSIYRPGPVAPTGQQSVTPQPGQGSAKPTPGPH